MKALVLISIALFTFSIVNAHTITIHPGTSAPTFITEHGDSVNVTCEQKFPLAKQCKIRVAPTGCKDSTPYEIIYVHNEVSVDSLCFQYKEAAMISYRSYKEMGTCL